MTLDQASPHGGLKSTYVLGDAALADVQVGGSALEAAAVCDRDKTAERGDVKDRRHDPSVVTGVNPDGPGDGPITIRDQWSLQPVVGVRQLSALS